MSAVLGEARGTQLRPIEWILLAYLALVSVISLSQGFGAAGTPWVLTINALIGVLIALVARPSMGPLGLGLREVFPLLLLPALYGELDLLHGIGRTIVHDVTVQRWEQWLFGFQPSRDWWRSAPSAFWSTILHGAYFAFYPIIAAPVAWFLIRGNQPAMRRAVLWIMVTFIVCYLVFMAFPVSGPYYEFARPSGAFIANPMARLVYATLAQGSSYGAAFPSSHVAAAVAATLAAFAGSRRLGLLLTIPTLLLAVGVVYCQMHYAIDALTGAALGFGIPALLNARVDPAPP